MIDGASWRKTNSENSTVSQEDLSDDGVISGHVPKQSLTTLDLTQTDNGGENLKIMLQLLRLPV